MMEHDQNGRGGTYSEETSNTTSRVPPASRAVRLVVLGLTFLGVIAVVQFSVTIDIRDQAEYRAVKEMFGALLGVAAGIPLIGFFFY